VPRRPASPERLQYLRDYQRTWIARRRAEWFADKQCVRCGSVEKLRLDHIDAKTKVRRMDHAIWSWSLERREAEIAKCQVLCEECHKLKTAENNEYPRGERIGRSKLTEADVRAIRAAAAGATQQLVARYKVGSTTIQQIRRGET
jgi:5-methylcytosine-specific restriction endonuclease McrA